ncbi:hypothetical protein [Clostridium magnum]|uniref:Uncharacterized protein n=1 Tax=Clostridium magnum DSM 2767 TaxID=1121326 RepID=A0A162UXP4_9CLOT|nr:hypothetical protein [Clostridium magnum]KZL94393.1 hypothetical protein CLMAG_14460 [Clostridium magnum DSM 2767]SHJ59102.1 hypothetical protein SAMN02745944_06197 [Clostridium magnum DSM 2767]
MGLLIKYIIMSAMLGFTGNKLFNKKNKSNLNSIKWACIIGSLLTIIHLILISI